MKEKLIDLAHDYFDSVPWYADIADLNPEELIDHLISNGVTIPVRCKGCKHWMYEYDDVGLCVTDVPDIEGVQSLLVISVPTEKGEPMIENIALILLGFAVGMLVYEFLCREDEKIEMLRPDRIAIEEKRIVTANAAFDLPMEDLANGVSGRYVQEEIMYELAKQVWPYAAVVMQDSKLFGVRRYHAQVKVVDMGNLNPFANREGERYERKADGIDRRI